MTFLENNQLFEFCVILLASIVNCILHFAIKGSAILLSGKKKGVIRGFLQGVVAVGIFAFATIIFIDGDIKYYHICVYIALVFCLIKLCYLMSSFVGKRKRKD